MQVWKLANISQLCHGVEDVLYRSAMSLIIDSDGHDGIENGLFRSTMSWNIATDSDENAGTGSGLSRISYVIDYNCKR